ncbi:MAG: GntR family transcriptional regulator [Acidobacteriota bacterium]
MIQVVTGDARPVFRQIVDGLRMKIATGELSPGTRLPSVRGLALQLTINSNTVAKAYAELTSEGLIESRKGVGVFVCEPRQRLSDDERRRRLDEALQHFVSAVVALGYSPQEILARLSSELEPLVAKEPKP